MTGHPQADAVLLFLGTAAVTLTIVTFLLIVANKQSVK